MTAARQYKEVVAGITAALSTQREQDREKATELNRALGERGGLAADMYAANERAALTRAVAELHWQAALDALWAESWLTLRPRPTPDPAAHNLPLDMVDTEVERASAVLQDAVRRRFGIPRRRS